MRFRAADVPSSVNYSRVVGASLVAIATVATVGSAGCVTSAFGGQNREAATLEVSNKGWTDIAVFLERGGTRVRLGLSPALSDRRFRLSPEQAPPGETISFLADPVGSTDVYRSPSVRMHEGAVLLWTLQNNLAQSALRVR